MTRSDLEHAIRAACDVADCNEVIIVGSQAVLAQFPNAPDEITYSREVDVFTGWCLEVHDLAASKLTAGREKDLDYVAALLRHAMIALRTLDERIATLPILPERRTHVARVAARLAREAGGAPG